MLTQMHTDNPIQAFNHAVEIFVSRDQEPEPHVHRVGEARLWLTM
jgi:hypothetical protein